MVVRAFMHLYLDQIRHKRENVAWGFLKLCSDFSAGSVSKKFRFRCSWLLVLLPGPIGCKLDIAALCFCPSDVAKT